jgi:hypothetical protein
MYLERAREELLLRFLQAYDVKNTTVLSSIIQHAEQDQPLKTILWETVPTYLSEEDHLTSKEAGERLEALFEQSQEKPVSRSLARVAAQLQIHLAYQKELLQEVRANFSGILKALSIFIQSEELLPDTVDLPWVQNLFQRYHFLLPTSFALQFLQTARELSPKKDTSLPQISPSPFSENKREWQSPPHAER